MRRYARLLGVQLRASLTAAMQYRVDFVLGGLMSLGWVVWTLLPLLVVFDARHDVAGWSRDEALVVVAWFTILRAFLEGVINPSLVVIVEQIRTGTLDFVLLKPADSQFLVSTARFAPFKIFDVIAGLVILVIAFRGIGRAPALGDLVVAGILLAAGVLVLYSIWILVVCASFWVIRLDNLSYLFGSIFDAARWPLAVFRGAWKTLFTFIIPLGLMTTYPAMALLGTLDPQTALASVGGALFFLLASRALWNKALGRYTSSSS